MFFWVEFKIRAARLDVLLIAYSNSDQTRMIPGTNPFVAVIVFDQDSLLR